MGGLISYDDDNDIDIDNDDDDDDDDNVNEDHDNDVFFKNLFFCRIIIVEALSE